jgi:hypothetical protein
VLATLDSVRRIQAIKAAGGTVVIDKPKESLLIPTKALQHKPVVAPPMGQRPIDKLYDHSKGDIVMPDTKPEASGRYSSHVCVLSTHAPQCRREHVWRPQRAPRQGSFPI